MSRRAGDGVRPIVEGGMMLSMVAAFLAAQAVPAAPAQRILAATGYVATGHEEDGLWFQFAQSPLRFRVRASRRDLETYVRMLSTAQDRGVAVSVRFDADAGRADAAEGYVEFPLCSLAVGTEPRFGDERANCPAGPAAAPETAEAALALGLALLASQPAQARHTLGLALGDQRLAPRLRAIALDARGDAAEAAAVALPWASEAFDRETLAALADYRAWVTIEPDEPRAYYATARALANLGGYEEAMEIYRAIGRRMPDEGFNVAISSGALLRKQGRYPEALAVLDAYVARAGPQIGMRYSYHRAWTLQLLGRPAEAVAEIDRGLESQPDYPYAFFMRSCANARLGRLRPALADQERGLALLDGWSASPEFTDNVQRSRAMVETLRRLAGTGEQPTDAPCQAFWQRDIRSRARSALLGPVRR